MDPYSPCPCGSGNKFKWCCITFWEGIDKAHEALANGQGESSLRQMAALVTAHPGIAEIHGRFAELLILNGRIEEAEAELEKAFQLQANYPLGFYLKACLRLEEGEMEGALILLRKSSQAYHPEARDNLARVYQMIAEAEMGRNRSLASLAALRTAARFAPDNQQINELLTSITKPESKLPQTIKEQIHFLADSDPARKNGLEPLLESPDLRLENLPGVFEEILKKDTSNQAARFNLGLSQAWVGQNRECLATLENFIQAEEDPDKLELAAYLQEIMRFGKGLENESDYVNHQIIAEISNGELLEKWLQEMSAARRITPLSQDPQTGAITFFLLEENASGLLTSGSTTKEFAKILGYLTVVPPMIFSWGYDKQKLDSLKHEWITRLAVPLNQIRETLLVSDFGSLLLSGAVLPLTGKDKEKSRQVVATQVEKYFEEVWVHQARKSLQGNSPIDAVGHPLLKKKLPGILRLYEEVLSNQNDGLYDFSRLRHKLSLHGATANAPGAVMSIQAMNPADLAGLKVEALSLGELELAFKTALALDAGELARRFAKEIASNELAGDPGTYLNAVKNLCELDWEEKNQEAMTCRLQKGLGQLQEKGHSALATDLEIHFLKALVRFKDAQGIVKKTKEMVGNEPENDKVLIACVENLLRVNCNTEAGKLAENGLQFAKKKGNSDLAGFFQEMIQAAKK